MSLTRVGRLLGLASLIFMLDTSPAIAEVPPSELDLVILIDQSGSMWGHPQYHPLPNDRYDHRISAARAVLDRLAADVANTDRVHRFSIVDFGDVVEVSWSNEVIRHDPGEPGARERLRDEAVKRVAARDWINTNTPDALVVASAELKKMQDAQPLENRRRIVLVITDGRPQKPPASLEQMRQRTGSEARKLVAAGNELWIVALNDASNYWLDGDGAFWQSLVGDAQRTHLAERASRDLPKGVDRMVTAWLGHGPPVPHPGGSAGVGGSFTAPPYLGHLAFRVHFEQPRDPGLVTITTPDGLAVARESAGSSGAPATYARFSLDDPPPGVYTYQIESGATDITPEPHPPELSRLVPGPGTDLEIETRVVYQAKLRSGRALELLEKWPLVASIEVVAPDGTRTELPAAYESEGKFVVAAWKPAIAGNHTLRLRGWVEIEGKKVDVFASASTAESTVEISKAKPLHLRLESPSPESGLFVSPWAENARFSFELVDGAGEEVDSSSVVTKPDGWLSLERLDSSGVVLGPAVVLTAGEDGCFEAELPIEANWRGSDRLFGLGNVFVRVRPEPERLREEYALRGIELSESLESLRVNGDPFSLGPIPIRLSSWLVALALLLILAILLGLLAVVAIRLLPAWRISRRDGNRSIELKVYDIANDISGANAKVFRITGQAFVKLDGQVRIYLEAESKVADYFRLTRIDAPGRSRARLQYRWLGEKKIQETQLAAGSGPKILKVEATVEGRPVAELVEN